MRVKNGKTVQRVLLRLRIPANYSKDANIWKSSLLSTRRFQIAMKLQFSTTTGTLNLENAKLSLTWPTHGSATYSPNTKLSLKTWPFRRLSPLWSRVVLLPKEQRSSILSEPTRRAAEEWKSFDFYIFCWNNYLIN